MNGARAHRCHALALAYLLVLVDVDMDLLRLGDVMRLTRRASIDVVACLIVVVALHQLTRAAALRRVALTGVIGV